MIRAGRLDRRVTIQSRDTTQDDRGGQSATWNDEATVWAQKTDLKGNEHLAAFKRFVDADTKFTIRYRGGMTPLKRISYGGLNYYIIGVLEIGRREGLDILCRAEANNPEAL